MKQLTVTYYRVLDFVQRNWTRFRATEAGAATAWLAPRALKVLWVLTKLTLVLCALVMVIPFAIVFMFTPGRKAVLTSVTRIIVAGIGFIAADRLLERRLQHAEAMKKLKP